MAKYDITHSCGHQSVAQIVGPTAGRDRQVAMLESKVCAECWKLAQKEKDARLVESAPQMPAMSGSEKQVDWANTIRAKWASESHDCARKEYIINSKIDAKWWIDNRMGLPAFKKEVVKPEIQLEMILKRVDLFLGKIDRAEQIAADAWVNTQKDQRKWVATQNGLSELANRDGLAFASWQDFCKDLTV